MEKVIEKLSSIETSKSKLGEHIAKLSSDIKEQESQRNEKLSDSPDFDNNINDDKSIKTDKSKKIKKSRMSVSISSVSSQKKDKKKKKKKNKSKSKSSDDDSSKKSSSSSRSSSSDSSKSSVSKSSRSRKSFKKSKTAKHGSTVSIARKDAVRSMTKRAEKASALGINKKSMSKSSGSSESSVAEALEEMRFEFKAQHKELAKEVKRMTIWQKSEQDDMWTTFKEGLEMHVNEMEAEARKTRLFTDSRFKLKSEQYEKSLVQVEVDCAVKTAKV